MHVLTGTNLDRQIKGSSSLEQGCLCVREYVYIKGHRVKQRKEINLPHEKLKRYFKSEMLISGDRIES